MEEQKWNSLVMGEWMIYSLVKGKLLYYGLAKGELLLLWVCFLIAVPVFDVV